MIKLFYKLKNDPRIRNSLWTFIEKAISLFGLIFIISAVAKYTGLGLSLWQKDEFKLDNEVKPKALLVTEKTVLSKTTIEELNKLWLGITPDSQTKLREVFSQRKTEIENGF